MRERLQDARTQSTAPTAALRSGSSSFSSAYAPKSLCLQQPASGELLSCMAPPSKNSSPLKHEALDSFEISNYNLNLNSNLNSPERSIPPEVRCMACGAMVPVPAHAPPCDIKPSRVSSGNAPQNILGSYLAEGVCSTLSLSSYANDSVPNSKRASRDATSAFDFDDALPHISQLLPPGACGSQRLPEEGSFSQLSEAGVRLGFFHEICLFCVPLGRAHCIL